MGVLGTSFLTVRHTMSRLGMHPRRLLVSNGHFGGCASVPRAAIVGKSKGCLSVTTTSVLTGACHSSCVGQLRRRFPCCS